MTIKTSVTSSRGHLFSNSFSENRKLGLKNMKQAFPAYPQEFKEATLLMIEHLLKFYFAHTLPLLHRSYPKCLFLGCINTIN